MPKGKRQPQAGLRPPSLRGAVVVDAIYGKPRVRAWPKPRGENRHPTNIFWTEWLKGVTFLWRYQPPKFIAQLTEATKNSPWMPRDPFISGARGRAWSFTDQDGRTWYPVPAKQAVSSSLDAIGQLVGAMLFRLNNSWEPIPGPTQSGQILESTGTDTLPEWVTPTSPGASLDAWSPITPPEAPDSEDEEFQTPGAGAPTGWAEVDHGSLTTVSVDDAGLLLAQATHAGDSLSGIYKAIPSGDFTISTRVTLQALKAGFVHAGLAFWEDATNASGRLYTFHLRFTSSAVNIEIVRWTSYTTFHSNVLTSAALPFTRAHAWLRVRRTGSTYAFDVSEDGLGWTRIHSGSLAFSVADFGPVFNNNASGANATGRTNFVRYLDNDQGVTGLLAGRRV